MKKIYSLFAVTGLLLAGSSVKAAEVSSSGIELSGTVDIVTGWQHDDENALGSPFGGPLGWFRGSTAPSRDTFNFYVNEVELDIEKSFGDNIRARADLDFGRALSGSGTNLGGDKGVELEQGYVTLDLWGTELLLGRFNVPIGSYAGDRHVNPTVSLSNAFLFLTPGNATGAKIYHKFGDHVDWHLYAVNNLADSNPVGFPVAGGNTPNPGGLHTGSPIPSYGTRIGFNWGETEKASRLGLSYAGGPERVGCLDDNGVASYCNDKFTHIIDLDFSFGITPRFRLSGEGVYRQDASEVDGAEADKAFAALVYGNYDFENAWSLFFRYEFLQDRSGFYTSLDQNIHDFAVGAGYKITDNAKLKLEYSPYIFDPRAEGVDSSWSHGVAMEFAYLF